MKQQWLWGSLAVVVLAVSGCGGDNDSSSTKLSSMEREVAYLADESGMALYVFDNDTAGVSNCTGDCLTKWPKFVDADAGAEGGVITVVSEDHSAYLGHPLYYFFQDTAAGDRTGDEVNGIWHLVHPSSGFSETTDTKLSSDLVTQHYLADAKGYALYVFDNDSEGVSNCAGDCLTKWPLFYAENEKLELPAGVDAEDFGVITREDGALQSTYRGLPLYYFFQDVEPEQTYGDWVNGIWHLVEINP